MATSASASPRKAASRSDLRALSDLRAPPDPASIKLPESPEKRILRSAKSHAQLFSAQSSMRQPRAPVISKPSRELPNTPAIPTHSLPSRTRANSDVPIPFERQRAARKPLATLTNPPLVPHHARKSSLEVTLRDGPPAGTSSASSISLLRQSVLTSGVAATKEGMSDYRTYVWLALLNIPPLPTNEYLDLIHRGRSPAYSKIGNDVFRTLATDTLFKRRVTDASVTRVLNATAWRIHESQSADPPPSIAQMPYLQGINVLSAPLLYASRSETQAYALLTTLLRDHIPSYISPTMSGVHSALDLIDRILVLREPNLSTYMLEKVGPAKVYAFASILTLSACTPPLPEVLKLWDFLFAFGVHLNVVCVVAQLILMKQKLYDSSSPGKLLRNFPHLDTKAVIALTLVIVRDLPEDLYAEIVLHGRV